MALLQDPALAADEGDVLVTFPQARTLMLLAFAALLALVAATILRMSVGPAITAPSAKTVVVGGGRSTPGSTAHARTLYRISLGR